jgi:N-methylhydantoinase B/oxoprolinase/acetone carboxylase alpha subunit
VNGVEIDPGSDGTLMPGDELVIETPGGGGLGPVNLRDQGLVVRDLTEEVTSHHWMGG